MTRRDHTSCLRPENSMTVWLLFREISDQYGTNELVGVFLNEQEAKVAGNTQNRRTFVKSAPVGRVFRKEHGSYGDYV